MFIGLGVILLLLLVLALLPILVAIVVLWHGRRASHRAETGEPEPKVRDA